MGWSLFSSVIDVLRRCWPKTTCVRFPPSPITPHICFDFNVLLNLTLQCWRSLQIQKYYRDSILYIDILCFVFVWCACSRILCLGTSDVTDVVDRFVRDPACTPPQGKPRSCIFYLRFIIFMLPFFFVVFFLLLNHVCLVCNRLERYYVCVVASTAFLPHSPLNERILHNTHFFVVKGEGGGRGLLQMFA